MKKLLVLLVIVGSVALGQFSGPYYIGALGTGPSGSDPTYQTLKAANDAINAGTVTGNVTFYITSDLTEIANSALGVNTAGFTITYKPLDDLSTRTITFSKATDNGALSGGFVIGLANIDDWNTLTTTDNVVIDGYADAGSTRRLIWKSSAAANYLTGPLGVAGNSNNITIKNCTVISEAAASAGASNTYAIQIRNRFAVSNFNPDNITIDNNDITTTSVNTANGVGVSVNSTPTPATGIVIKNNTITARHRGIFMSYCASYEASGNTISVNHTTSGYASVGIAGNSGNSGIHNVFNNKLIQLGTATTTGAGNGIRGIQASGGGTYNIYNNFITGFSTPATGTAEAVGIRVGVGSTIYNNTIVMNNVSTTGPGTTPTAGIVAYTTTCDIQNNIIITEEDDFASYCIYASSLPATSNYNNLYRSGTVNAKIGFYTAAQATLLDWQTATITKDANSKSVAVTFAGATDLHLAGGSDGDVNLIGTPLASPYDFDIDGDGRNGTFPYMGADETNTLLPVELTTFTAVARGKNVELKWATATEHNNLGFEIEKSVNGVWSKIGFVQGAGNSNAPKEYGYVDAVNENATYSYRLKQIDRDGKFTYNNAIEVQVNAAVNSYQLAQNFPNPFNPATTIRFSVPQMENASVKVYDVTGREVVTLFNGVAAPGQVYNVQFNGAGLASGIYFYVLQTQSYRDVKKMSLLK